MPPFRSRRSHAVTATVVAVLLGAGGAPASAAPDPDTSSEAAQQLRELTREAEVLTEDYKSAEDRHKAREAELARAEAAAKKASGRASEARSEEGALREEVDALTAASYRGADRSELSALLTSENPDEYLDRVSVLRKLAGDYDTTVDTVARATEKAEKAERRAREARDAAAKAETEAARLENEIAERKAAMDERIAEVKRQYENLSQQEKEDFAGGGSEDVGSIGGTGAATTAVNAALGKQGSPYVWGAKGPNRFDCSGLVQWSYEQAGISLPASTRTQIDEGRSVSTSQLRPGDVVFYYSSASHNGLYIGNGKVVHAPTEGQDVKVENYRDIGDVHSVRRMVG
ncbi:cell wall-associated NlpC family hydrolase [Actinopolyspora biskrensis]|uniref:Cell wall-associated NlpC family hydrolase n=1 Tax=Actinopolyspora biskrensis TaxID=1470178 RepID=A0A852Z0B8_9ACTN|nr:C40 family peptidase [Actinopolyspora biskrensis]NYH79239.1 cell wall-associated NlpC family hydrolase [Actinopolyspora biskrensis]